MKILDDCIIFIYLFLAVYIDPSNETNKDFYSGIIAEPPKTMNRHRYLVSLTSFFVIGDC
jgi:hypothetical protein